MKDSNNNNYVSKNYLNLFKIVPVKMESIQSFTDIAIALNGLDSGLVKKYKNYSTTYFHSQNHELTHLAHL